jgi:uncharacterized protein YdaU (DUF1376 family)
MEKYSDHFELKIAGLIIQQWIKGKTETEIEKITQKYVKKRLNDFFCQKQYEVIYKRIREEIRESDNI